MHNFPHPPRQPQGLEPLILTDSDNIQVVYVSAFVGPAVGGIRWSFSEEKAREQMDQYASDADYNNSWLFSFPCWLSSNLNGSAITVLIDAHYADHCAEAMKS